MRITYVSMDPGVPAFGRKGASVHVQELLRGYRRLGHVATLVAVRTGGGCPADLSDLTVVDASAALPSDPAERARVMRGHDDAVERLIDGLGQVDLVHERYSLWGGAGVRAARALGIPAVLEVNAPLIDEEAKHRVLVDAPVARSRLIAAVRAATVVVAVSRPVRDWVRERCGEETPITVIPNGVDPVRFRPGDARDPRSFTVGFVGSLKPWHGVEILVEAVARLREHVSGIRLLLVGDGPMREPLLAQAARQRVEVEHTGAIDPLEVPKQLWRMDVACAPYPGHGEETYFSPLKVLEYLAAGLPVIASAVGQVPELLDHGHCGRLVRGGDPEALADAIAKLAAYPATRGLLGTRGRAHVIDRFGWESVVRRTIDAAMSTDRPATTAVV